MHDKINILFFFLILEIKAFNNVIFFRSQAQKLDPNLSLSLILRLSLAWLINQAKLSQDQVFWFFHEFNPKHYF